MSEYFDQLSLEKKINKLKYLLSESVRCSEKRRRWIEKSHHQDGCAYSDNGYSGRCDCSCKKTILERKYSDYLDILKGSAGNRKSTMGGER